MKNNFILVFICYLLFLPLIKLSYAYINVSNCTTINSTFLGSENEVRLNDSISNHDGNCFRIDADNVIFDCQNFGNYIQGDGDYTGIGIHIPLSSNITIKNCNISEFGYGIQLSDTHSNYVTNIVSSKSYYAGIRMDNCDNSCFSNINVSKNVGSSSVKGLYVRASEVNNFTNIISNYNKIGIGFEDGSYNNIILNSNFKYNVNYNIQFFNSSASSHSQNNTFTNNYLGNSSRIVSVNWSDTPNFFSGNWYTYYNGCFEGSSVCDSNPHIEGEILNTNVQSNIFPFGSLFFSTIIVVGGLIMN